MNPQPSEYIKQFETMSKPALNQPITDSMIENWLVSYLSQTLEVDSHTIDITIPFDRYGLDSSAAIGLTGDLQEWLGRELDPTLLFDYPTIETLANHLANN